MDWFIDTVENSQSWKHFKHFQTEKSWENCSRYLLDKYSTSHWWQQFVVYSCFAREQGNNKSCHREGNNIRCGQDVLLSHELIMRSEVKPCICWDRHNLQWSKAWTRTVREAWPFIVSSSQTWISLPTRSRTVSTAWVLPIINSRANWMKEERRQTLEVAS